MHQKMKTNSTKKFNLLYKDTNKEVNIINYPYYRTIPIKNISCKQKRRGEECKQDKSDMIEQKVVYSPIIKPALPILNVTQIDNTNCYTIEMPNNNSEDLKKFIEEQQTKFIEEQQNKMAENNELIQIQLEKIEQNRISIQSNNYHLEQQLINYNNNLTILNNQYSQYKMNENEIERQQEILNIQYNQIVEYENQIQLNLVSQQIFYNNNNQYT